MLVVLIKDISFTDFSDLNVIIPVGTLLYICPESHVAYSNGLHFDICKTEYTTVN